MSRLRNVLGATYFKRVECLKWSKYVNYVSKRFLTLDITMQRESIKTYVFFDTETTGLPHMEHNKTRIVELCFAAVQAEHLSLGVFPRILPKINLCFNPRKYIHPSATDASGLTNELLEEQPEFTVATTKLLEDFLNMQRKPICLVAHNGNRFDYPILRAELHKTGNQLPSDILCVDSLVIFKLLYNEDLKEARRNKESVVNDLPIELQDGYDQLLFSVLEDLQNSVNDIPIKAVQKRLTVEEIQKRNETTPQKQIFINQYEGNSSNARKQLSFECPQISFKLVDLYQLLTEKVPIDAHKAEYDVLMLIECAGKLGERFTDWSNINAIRLCDIPMMQPGISF